MPDDEQLHLLRDLLAKPLTEEAAVMRFLVEVRKNVEDKKDRYNVLQFFGDWLVHKQLDRKGAQEIIAELDRFVGDVRTAGGTATQEQINKLAPLLSFRLMQRDLAVFLAEHKLDGTLVSEESRFQPFFEKYIDLIDKTPLVVKPADAAKYSITNIDRITVKKSLITLGPPAAADARFRFRIVWTLYKGTTEVGPISSEIWLEEKDATTTVPVLQERTDLATGEVTILGLESKTFFG